MDDSLKTPWRRFQLKGSPDTLEPDDRTLYRTVAETARANQNVTAYDFLGTTASYKEFLESVDATAAAFARLGIQKGDTMTVCLPNCPQAVFAFYALNKLGVVASMIHPLSVSEEIRTFLDISSSRWMLTLDAFWPRVEPAVRDSSVEKTICCRIQQHMPLPIKIGFHITKGRKIKKIPKDAPVVFWEKILQDAKASGAPSPEAQRSARDTAVILYSGGTTGTPKGIMLSDWNFNALTQALCWQLEGGVRPGDKVLSILPLFHGFGLGVSTNLYLTRGGTCILVPQFSAEEVVKVLLKKKPQFIAGVPTLFEALCIHPKIRDVDFSTLRGCFGGGDKVPETVKKRFDEVITSGGGTTELVEGYGLTETVTACTVLPQGEYRKGSVGIPLPGIFAKIIDPDTLEELPYGEEGELCVTGPTNMLGYIGRPEETADVIQDHPDGRSWVHTGDLCSMDSDGFIYFKMRLKRMVKVSGIAVYPPQVEEVLRSHPAVRDACVIGIPDPYKMNVIRAYIVPHDTPGETLAQDILDSIQDKLNRWSIPKDIVFRTQLPLTRVGKIAYTELEEEALATLKSASAG